MPRDDGESVWGIVLAAGSGDRFGDRKQFLEVDGRQMVDLAVLAATSACDEVVVVVPKGTEWRGPDVTHVVDGGDHRSASVRRALDVIPASADITVVHQAAHPLASTRLFRAVITAVRMGAVAAVPGLRPADMIQRVADGQVVEPVGRDDLVIVQTPGAFRTDVLRAAHAAAPEAIEDTALVLALGESVTVVSGEATNVHIATRDDIDLVECLAGRARIRG